MNGVRGLTTTEKGQMFLGKLETYSTLRKKEERRGESTVIIGGGGPPIRIARRASITGSLGLVEEEGGGGAVRGFTWSLSKVDKIEVNSKMLKLAEEIAQQQLVAEKERVFPCLTL